jgi:hypothetical protein
MFIGLIWIVVGIAVALWSGFADGETMRQAFAQQAVAVQWHLTLTSAIGLMLSAEGCRMFQYGWYNRRRW